jgi:hypothetical protein
MWFKDKEVRMKRYGHISDWNTENITDMSYAFYYGGPARKFYLDCSFGPFNEDIDRWNTSNVTKMSCMFGAAREFNQDISGTPARWWTWNPCLLRPYLSTNPSVIGMLEM